MTEPVLDVAELRSAPLGLPERFRLALADRAATTLRVGAVLRHLPHKRLVLRIEQADGGPAHIAKLFLQNGAREAARERAGLATYAAAGLRVPAALEETSTDDAVLSLFEAIEPAQTLAAHWPELSTAARRVCLRTLANALARLHDAGADLWDPHFGNFLLMDSTETPELVAVDGGALRPTTGPLPMRTRIANLGLLLAQLPVADDGLLADVLDAYDANLSHATVAAQRDRARLRRVRQLIAKSQRDCSEFAVQHTVRRRVVVRRALAEQLAPLLETLDETIADARVLKAGRTATVVAIDQANGARWICKRYNLKSWWHRLMRAWRLTRAEHSWRAAIRLAALGIATPRVVALVVERLGPLRGRAFLLCEPAPGAPLDALLAESTTANQPRLRERVLRALIGFHNAGLVHGDLKASNLFVNDRAVSFIDLDSLTAPRWRGWRDRGQQRDRTRLLANVRDASIRAEWQTLLAAGVASANTASGAIRTA